MSIRVLIVEEAPMARRRIRQLLEQRTGAEVVGEFDDPQAAARAARALKPALLFLDLQLPQPRCQELLDALDGNPLPSLIFTTPHDPRAIRALDSCGLTYVLKPVLQKGFLRAWERATQRPGPELGRRELIKLIDHVQDRHNRLQRLLVRSNGRLLVLSTDEIDWIEAEANGVRIHAGESSHFLRKSLSLCESKLDPDKFARIHRSYLVHLDRIQELVPHAYGDYRIVLRSGRELPMSRSYRYKLRRLHGPD
jgi:two-component system LytT family response regulator